MVREPSLFVLVLLLCGASLLAACGEPSDEPEDCSSNEYFDEAKELCFTCPAIDPPTCASGCGFRIEPDERGCPVATCELPSHDPETGLSVCGECAADEFFSNATLGCEACSGPTSCEGSSPQKVVADDRCALRCPDVSADADES